MSNNPEEELPLAKALKKAAGIADAPREYTRREMLSKMAQTSVAVAATSGLAVWLYDRDTTSAQTLPKIRNHRVGPAQGGVEMAIVRGTNAVESLRKALKAVGGLESFVKSGERVVVKPNIGWNRLPEQAANTNPELVAEVVRQLVALGAREVWVTDVPVNNASS